MKIISWNVNGIRAVYRKEAIQWIFDESFDIICLQEIKSLAEQVPVEIRNPVGYHSYFNSPDIKKGYSGTALYTKTKPIDVFYGIDKKKDVEGRIVGAEFENFFILNVYFPNGGGGPERLEYKLKFYADFLSFIKKLEKKKPVIFCGDINTAHTAIDLARPKENEQNTGFLPVERAWIDTVVSSGYVDTFRALNRDTVNAYTYWDMKTFARERNVGWRIDYFFLSKKIATSIQAVEILSEKYGSDHCPITINIKEIV